MSELAKELKEAMHSIEKAIYYIKMTTNEDKQMLILPQLKKALKSLSEIAEYYKI